MKVERGHRGLKINIDFDLDILYVHNVSKLFYLINLTSLYYKNGLTRFKSTNYIWLKLAFSFVSYSICSTLLSSGNER